MFDEYFEYFGLTGGVLIIIGVGLLLFLIVAIVLEHRTKLLFPERENPREVSLEDELAALDDEGE